MSPEVLIYIQTVKSFFEKNQETKFYFIGKTDEENFFEKLSSVSQKNFEKNGEAMLTQEQFETLRKLTQEKELIEITDNSIFIDFKDFGKICLN